MTDYSKMSDFEINKAVAIALGAKQVDYYENGDRCAIFYELGDKNLTVRRGKSLLSEKFDPCNNPADAWPIIVDNRISLMMDYADWDKCTAAYGDDGHFSPEIECTEENPLRAAMIVFLMIQEQG
ncbi:DUF2591 domain-containing protein [Serratia quinivorans]|uniref:DUF2591 domain-containing protein n=1 Tax=Serratia quinivorans TaxID=137545 RepID=UPI0021BDACF2|nr:DUF2591 domain-containing protein [Serratia quinivorans]